MTHHSLRVVQKTYPLDPDLLQLVCVGIEGAEDSEHLHHLHSHGRQLLSLNLVQDQVQQVGITVVGLDHVACTDEGVRPSA
jgi:hypothetical protein